jgi:hypothetical protein
MKAEIIAALEKLLENEDVLDVQQEFKKLSTQFKALRVSAKTEAEKSPDSTAISNPEEVGNPSGAASEDAAEDGKVGAGSKATQNSESQTEQISEKTAPLNDSSDNLGKLEVEQADDAVKLNDNQESSIDATQPDVASEGISAPHDTQDSTGSENPKAEKDVIESMEEEAPNVNAESPSGEITAETEVETEKDLHDEKFKELTDLFKAKMTAAKAARKKIEEDTLIKAKDLLGELEKLVAQEENIGKAFSGFNAIRDHWKALPKVSNDDYRELNMEYNKLVERFFYNINIYKELKELDLKHNLEQKLLVLEDQKKLLDLNDIRLLEVEVRMNQDRWNEIGPTFKEEWEKLKDEFWTLTRTIYGKIQAFYDQRRDEFEKNLEAKKALLEEVKRVEQLELKSPKKWQEKTKLVIDLQHQWKMIGFVPKDKAGTIWKEFRKTCDAFFEKKRQHFAEIHEVHEANKLAKEKLVNQAEQLKDSQEWNETSKVLIQLQNDWKSIGPAHQRDDNALWRRFRQACDHFFTARNAQKSGESAEQAENLIKKKALIDKIAGHKPGPDSDTNIEQLKAFGEEWRGIGHVPFKEKDAINKAYKKVMDEQFDGLKIERKVRQQVQFEEKVENLKEARGGERLLQKEEDFVRNKINKIRAEINQYENNMGFFANSKGAEKLKEEVIKKIDKAKAEVEELEGQLQLLRNA